MEVLYSGLDFPHENGEFCEKLTSDYYSVYQFSTPFLYEKKGRLHKGNAGDIMIMAPSDVVYHGPQTEDTSFTNDWMYIDGEDFGALLKKYPLPTGTRLSLGRQNIIHSAIKRIREEQALKHQGFEMKINCILTEMLIDLHRLFRKSVLQTPEARIEAARDTIMCSLEKPWSLLEMAALCGYSQSRFSALYLKRFGRSPKADLLEARINCACGMLKYTELSVSAVAENCGFQSIYYFSKYFKKQTGIAPSAYY